MADVHVLPGVFRADFDTDVSATTIFKSAMDAGLKDVGIVGRGIDGKISVWGSSPDTDNTIGLLTRGINWLSGTTQIAHKEGE